MLEALTAERSARWRAPLWFVVAIAIVVYQLGPMLSAQWELFDDAETLSWSAPGAALTLSGVPAVVMTRTEVGNFGKTARYRPVYYTTRVLETAALGPSPRRWHLWRMAMFGIVIFLLFVAFDLWLGAWVGAALAIFVVANWYWQDVWLHLGPAEGLGMVGLSMFVLGAAFTTRHQLRAAVWLTAIGATIAIGSKESFLPLIAPCLLVLDWVRRRTARKRETIALAIPPVAMAGAVTLSTVLYSLRAGTDVYANPVGSASRVSWLFGGWGLALGGMLVLPMVLDAAGWKMFGAALHSPETRDAWRERIRAFRAVTWCAAAVVAFQLFIYSPIVTWPTWAARYDVPGRLASSALIGASVALFVAFCSLGAHRSWVRPFRALCVVTLLLIARREFPWALRGAALRQVADTRALDASLNSDAAALRQHPGVPIIVRWNSGDEIEAFGATLQLLRQRGIDGPFYLMPAPEAGPPDSGVFAAWSAQMKDLSVRGGRWYGAEITRWPVGGADALARLGPIAELRMKAYGIPAFALAEPRR